jgi:hypothetical protein
MFAVKSVRSDIGNPYFTRNLVADFLNAKKAFEHMARAIVSRVDNMSLKR